MLLSLFKFKKGSEEDIVNRVLKQVHDALPTTALNFQEDTKIINKISATKAQKNTQKKLLVNIIIFSSFALLIILFLGIIFRKFS